VTEIFPNFLIGGELKTFWTEESFPLYKNKSL
jgi:hypothetical protein